MKAINKVSLVFILLFNITLIYSQCDNYLQKAEMLFSQKKYADAKKQYSAYKECKPKAEGIDEKIAECESFLQCENYRQKAETADSQKRYDDAIKLYQDYKKCNPEAKDIDKKIAECNRKREISGKDKGGNNKQIYPESDNIPPSISAMEWYNQGISYDNQEDYAEAIQCYQQAVFLKRDMYQAWNNMGNAYQHQGNYTDAIQCFNNALNINSKHVAARINMGLAYYNQKKYTEAIQCYKQAVNVDSNNNLAWYNMGVCYVDQNNRSEALKCYTKAAQLGNKKAQELLTNIGHKW